MNTIQLEHHNHVAILKLSRGVTNAINLELIDELSGTLRKIKDDPKTHGLVLTSANDKFFSIGLDIPWLFPLGQEDFASFYKAFNRLCIDLFTLPKPTVAAIIGHATAGGCILALCCDYRLIAEGRKFMGLNEIKLGVPVPFAADCILRHLVGFRTARDITDSGNFYTGEKLLEMGLVDEMLPLNQVVSTARELITDFGEKSQEAFATIKANRTKPVESEILAQLEAREKSFVELWYSPKARERLKEAMEKF
jgi:enoyl-CoA hydratase/carnithine racemase